MMKNWINLNSIKRIGKAINDIDTKFPINKFIEHANEGFEELELKEKVNHIITSLNIHLPDEYPQTVKIFNDIPLNWNLNKGETDKFFDFWPIVDYVGKYGLEFPDLSLPLLAKFTPIFSAEFAIRPFVISNQELTFQYLEKWSLDSDEHVRRLVSEGIRPRIPWGIQLKKFVKDPSPIIPLLEKLKNDDSRYVTRSVANNLNDITKDNPKLVIDLLNEWKKDSTEERNWIIRHALRTLIKKGNPEVFNLLGYSNDIAIEIPTISLEKDNIVVGDYLECNFELESKNEDSHSLLIDYKIHYTLSKEKTGEKVFKYKKLQINPNEKLKLKLRHSFKQITTRKYYNGKHRIEILVNGKSKKEISFNLKINEKLPKK